MRVNDDAIDADDTAEIVKSPLSELAKMSTLKS